MARGGIAAPVVRERLRGGIEAGLDYDWLALTLSKLHARATISDVKAGLERDRYTPGLGNS